MHACMTAKVISLINYKGGCTKTTSAVGLGAALSRAGYEVLLVDCDPQGHLAAHFGIDHDDIQLSLENVLEQRKGHIGDIVLETATENLWLAPSRRGLTNSRNFLLNRVRRETILASSLSAVKSEVDFIILDTPPDEGILTLNAIYASDHLIIPTMLDTFTLSGMIPLSDSIAAVNEAFDYRNINVLGVLVNRFDRRLTRVNTHCMEFLEAGFGDTLFDTRIRTDESVKHAQSKGETVFQSFENSKAASDFTAFADEVIQRMS